GFFWHDVMLLPLGEPSAVNLRRWSHAWETSASWMGPPDMSEQYDAIVVGGGVMGTATALELASRGRHTLLLERFAFGHARGSSGGPTRIFRFTYEHPDYVRMAGPALDAWRELE